MSDANDRFRMCPTCQSKIDRKDFNASVKRCVTCYATMCDACAINAVCVNCYVLAENTQEVSAYYDEKHIHLIAD